MKIGDIELDRQLETPAENEAQALLRDALAVLGPNGEHWCVGAQEDRGRHCALGAVAKARGTAGVFRSILTGERSDALDALGRAAVEMGGISHNQNNLYAIANLNNKSGFVTVQRLFHRAIEIAGQPA